MILQLSLDTQQNWWNETTFIFIPSKIQCILFNHKPVINQQLYLNNTPISEYKTILILRIVFDNKLKWIPHLNNLKTPAKIKWTYLLITKLYPTTHKVQIKSYYLLYNISL